MPPTSTISFGGGVRPGRGLCPGLVPGAGNPFAAGSADVRALAAEEKLSLEEAARNARYAYLRREAERLGGVRIYTAHHADDNAETMLLNLVRGPALPASRGCP